ncbi:[histone H3]-dimethyl-L-lysine(36) demethylase [Malassezia yamatoensis]|uniref:JmjC domain-containing histone demethylation protein 1 n=1 Tax=Malassezia yamatoensis TaxID=253288 RepID=A0AAJ5YT71_9BASI|nr:[histone H3]-dimethyl-L-lysine(36) demethylase [Malassezia yamatoensis]
MLKTEDALNQGTQSGLPGLLPSKKQTEKLSDLKDEDRCPWCPADGDTYKELWVACFRCHTWYHTECAKVDDIQRYAKWCCDACQKLGYKHTMQPPRRASKRAHATTDYAAIQEGRPPDPLGRWEKYMEHCSSLKNCVRRVEGKYWTTDWLANDPEALSAPSMVSSLTDEKGAVTIQGMRVPPRSTSIRDIAQKVGMETQVEVIDVRTQMSSSSWTLEDWVAYFETPASQREKVLNVISLEVSGTPMESMICAPAMVRENDWVERDWPANKKPVCEDARKWPKVQRYVLMGVQGAFTDFHIDFAASSVYYHVVWGRKVFLFAPPTPANLSAYRAWTCSSRQEAEWLGDALHDLSRAEIQTGETMLIPSGWIHAVHTPQDTLVIGGNFLTDYSIPMQWRLEEMEIATKVPRKFRFPHLMRLAWYVAYGWTQRLQKQSAPPTILCNLPHLLRRLQRECENMLEVDAQGQKTLKARRSTESVPYDCIPDPNSLLETLQSLLEITPRKRQRT